MIRTKIVATLGPATAEVETLKRLFEEGVDVCRLNFSHGDLADHDRMLANIRKAAGGQSIAVLGDLCGPKIRLEKVADQSGSGGMPVNAGDEIRLQRQSILGRDGRVSCTHPSLIDELRAGDRFLVEDGLIRFLVKDKRPDEIVLACTSGGILKSGKGINLPDTPLSLSPITDRDWQCADWATEHDLDYLALSFVRRPDELRLLRKHLVERGSPIHLIAKIEKPEALQHIDGIIAASDGLMVARGDLGVEMDLAQVPIIQKDLVNRCRTAGKSVIVATQMLQSMIDQSSPTRAEVSDVANAIFDGADAVMLSGETSVGKYPVPAVHMMNHVGEITEAYIAQRGDECHMQAPPTGKLSEAVAHGVRQMVKDVPVKLVVLWSQSGTTARIFANHRFPIPLVALSTDPRALRRMGLYYGVCAMPMQGQLSMSDLIERVDRLVVDQGWATAGDGVIIVAGSSLGTPGTTNGIVLHTVGQTWSPTSGGGQCSTEQNP